MLSQVKVLNTSCIFLLNEYFNFEDGVQLSKLLWLKSEAQTPVDADCTIKVVDKPFITTGVGFLQSFTVIFTSQKDLRFHMIEWIEKQKRITPVVNSNWRVIPYSWWYNGKIKDYPLVFGLQSK